jgi:hypothetical protein
MRMRTIILLSDSHRIAVSGKHRTASGIMSLFFRQASACQIVRLNIAQLTEINPTISMESRLGVGHRLGGAFVYKSIACISTAPVSS